MRQELGECGLVVKAAVERDGLRLRQGVASTTLSDGRHIEIDIDLSGPLLITIRPSKKSGTWKTYVLSPTALVEAILAVEDR